MRLMLDPRVQRADAIAARYGMDIADVLDERDPRRRAVRVAGVLSNSMGRGVAL